MFGCVDDYLLDISKVKLQQFTTEAKSLYASDFKDMNLYRRYALIVCLIQYAQRRVKDALVIMFCRTMAKMHKKAEEELALLREQQSERTKHLINAFYDVLVACKQEISNEEKVEKMMQKISRHGGIDVLHDECEKIVAYHGNSPFPLLWKYFSSKRSTLLRLVRVLKLQTASQNKSLIEALQVVLINAHHASEYIIDEVDLSFASDDFSKVAKRVDAQYPDLSELIIDEQGNPILKKRYPKQRSQQAIWLAQEIRNRMPERNLLDILCNSHHYAGWAHEFGPITGFDSKLTDPIERYILTNFSYGTCMGPTQAAKHIKADITAHMLSWVNRRHVTPPLLDKALNSRGK